MVAVLTACRHQFVSYSGRTPSWAWIDLRHSDAEDDVRQNTNLVQRGVSPETKLSMLGEKSREELEYLDLSNTCWPQGYDASALRQFRRLRGVDLSGTRVSDTEARYLAGLRELRSVDLSDTAVTYQGIEGLQALELEELGLDWTCVNGGAVDALQRMRHLKVLGLSGAKFRHREFEKLAVLTELRTLRVAACANALPLRWVESLTNLEVLAVSGIRASDAHHIAKLRKLRELTIWEPGDVDFQVFGSIPDLAVLNVRDAQLSREQMTGLATIRTLRHLDLSRSRFTSSGGGSLGNTIEWLSLARTGTNDDDLRGLDTLTELRYLDLTGCHVTDAGLKHLRSLPKLEVVLLFGTQVTRDGVRSLRSDLAAKKRSLRGVSPGY